MAFADQIKLWILGLLIAPFIPLAVLAVLANTFRKPVPRR
jgi:hypothetical protein